LTSTAVIVDEYGVIVDEYRVIVDGYRNVISDRPEALPKT
jgi:hypothetical protein